LNIFRKTVEKITLYLNRARITGTLHEDQYTFFTTSRRILLRMKNVSDKICRENENTHFVFNNSPPQKSAIYETTWKNMVQPDRPQMTIRRMRIACWITEATNTHSVYVILIAFPVQEWLQKRASMLRYNYTVMLFFSTYFYEISAVFSV